MMPYWLLFGIVLFGVVAPRRLVPRQRKFVWVIVGVGIALMIGFRHEIGGDWFNYERQFDVVARMSFHDSIFTTKDPAYYPLGWLIARLGGDIHILNLACASLLAAGAMTLASRQPQPWLALLSAVPYLLIVVGMGYTRQGAALGCAMLGLAALGDGKVRKFVVWVIVGAAFHKSAALLIPIASLAATQDRIWTFVWVSAIAMLGYWIFVHGSSDVLWQNYVESGYASASEGAGIRVAMNAVPAVLMLKFRRRISEGEQERRLWTLMAIGALVCVPLLSLSATAVDRMALYFIPIQIFVFGHITRLASSTQHRTLLVVGVIVYYAAVQFVWLNFASHAHAWLPYSFWLFG